MAISLRQFRVVYNKYLLEFLQEGRVPSFEDVALRAGDDLPDPERPDEPITQFIPQAAETVFDIKIYNKAILDIAMDLGILYEESTDIELTNVQRILHADLFHSVHSHELKRLSHTLDSLLFAIGGGDENFFAAFDNFIDVSKTNIVESTPGIIDLEETKLALPIGLKGSLKLDMNHLSSRVNPSDFVINRTDVINIGNIPGTIFGNSFTDATKVWGIVLESENSGPVEISFTFRLQDEEFLNRITLQHHGEKPQRVYLTTSVDKLNIKDIIEYADGVVLNNQSEVVSVDFEDRLVDYIHVRATKTAADSFEETKDGVKKYRYIFGFRAIGVYITGRLANGTYESKSFDFSDDLTAIGRIAISAQESLPDGTQIEWSVAGVDDDDNIVGSFIPITPQSRLSNNGPPKEITLQDVLTNSKQFIIGDGDSITIETFNSINFQKLGEIGTIPVFGTASLFRGFRSWLRDKSQAVNPVLVKDNFIAFSKGDIQTLYSVTQEVLQMSLIEQASIVSNIAVASQPPLYNPSKGHVLIPEPDVNPDKDIAPDYAIYQALLNIEDVNVSVETDFENGVVGGQGQTTTRTIDLGSKIIKYDTPGDIRIERLTGTAVTYVDGTDFFVRLDDEGFPTGEIIGLHPDFTAPYDTPPPDWVLVKITYELDPDITRRVEDIRGHQIFFDLPEGSIPTNSVLIKYRHRAKEILKASVKAKGAFGIAGEAQIFVQGIDYIFDSVNSTIQRSSTGTIPDGADIYIDFKFNDIAQNLEQFFIWGKVEDPGGVVVKVATNPETFFSQENTLSPDLEAGEEFLASIPGVGLVNLTLATEWPVLTEYTQFVVKSKSPDDFDNALVNQIIKLRDQNNEFIFIQGGKYFDELIARREPLTQVSYTFLKTNVLKNDNSFFAVREIVLSGQLQYQVIVNFLPNVSPSFYPYVPEEDQGGALDGSGATGLLKVDEEFKIVWTNKESNSDAFKRVKIRSLLSRSQGAGGNVTPKVDGYFVKVSF